MLLPSTFVCKTIKEDCSVFAVLFFHFQSLVCCQIKHIGLLFVGKITPYPDGIFVNSQEHSCFLNNGNRYRQGQVKMGDFAVA
jgi:hypothetical protein